jgi:hypothetical protein
VSVACMVPPTVIGPPSSVGGLHGSADPSKAPAKAGPCTVRGTDFGLSRAPRWGRFLQPGWLYW